MARRGQRLQDEPQPPRTSRLNPGRTEPRAEADPHRFRGLEPDPAVEARCRAEVEKLERHYSRITGCAVSISLPHRRHHLGRLYSVSVRPAVPGREPVANRTPTQHHQDENLGAAIREAFDRARRQLEDQGRGQRGDVEQHQPPG
jgi:hypothetical protein